MITAQKQLAIDLLLSGEKKVDIADKVHVTSKTIYEWLKDPEFNSALEAQKKEVVTYADTYLKARTKTYLEKMDDIAMHSKDEKQRFQALVYLLDRSLGKAATNTKIELTPGTQNNEGESPESLLDEFKKFRKVDAPEVIDVTPD